MNEEKIAEKYVKQFGWVKNKGYKVSHEGFGDDMEYSYWLKDNLDDFIEKCEFWTHPDNDEFATEDVWDVVEMVEGQLKRKLGNVFLRGDTIILISPQN